MALDDLVSLFSISASPSVCVTLLGRRWWGVWARGAELSASVSASASGCAFVFRLGRWREVVLALGGAIEGLGGMRWS